jgi:hypothetical protein
VLSDAEAALLLRLAADRRDFPVLDLRDPERPTLADVFVRAWAAPGFVVRHADGPPAELLDGLGDRPPLVLVAADQAVEGPLAAALERPGAERVEDRGGRLRRARPPRWLDDLPPPEARDRSTRLLLRGRGEAERRLIDLPATFDVAVSGPEPRRVVRVGGESPFDTLPPPQWFRLPGEGRLRLTVGVRPDADGDRWEVTADGRPARPAGDPLAAAPPRLASLAVVFDRTCPDRWAWHHARRLLLNPRAYQPPDTEPLGDAPPPLTQADLNRDTRAGLAAALAALPDAARLPVHLVWFADCPELGVVGVEGVETPDDPAGDLGTRRADDLGGALARCTYCPGLDLWDPLEEGLRRAAEPLLGRAPPGAAVLIVGNSPPNLPVRAEGRLWRLLDFRSPGTTVRRRSDLFPELARTLDEAGVPLVYLFLTHDDPGDADPASHEVFCSLQEQVKDALRELVPLVEAPATVEGVARGLAEALPLLSEPRVSDVVVRPPAV